MIYNINYAYMMNEIFIQVFSPNQKHQLQLDHEHLQMRIEEFKKYIHKVLGYSSRIFLYRRPLICFHQLPYLPSNLSLGQIMQLYPNLALTFNNTQYRQQFDYYRSHVYSKEPSVDSIQIILQICQSNNFVHENYRVPLGSKLNFMLSICSRYGHSAYVQYYNTRIRLSTFGPNDTIKATLATFQDQMKRVTISVSSVDEGEAEKQFLQIVTSQTPINFQAFVMAQILGYEQRFVIDRRCQLKPLCCIIEYNMNAQVELLNSENQLAEDISTSQNSLKIKLRNKEAFLPIQVRDCVMIGSHDESIYFIESSHILHRITLIQGKYHKTLNYYLPAPPSDHLDEDLYFIKDEFVIGYSITIQSIKLKYYSLDGRLLFLKVHKWYHELYEIDFKAVDLFCVNLKVQPYKSKKTVRVFFIHEPEEYAEIEGFKEFFPSRRGFNSYSDGSGIFAVVHCWKPLVSVYQLRAKLLDIVPHPHNISNIIFSGKNDLFCLQYEVNTLTLYNMKGQQLIQILGEPSMRDYLFMEGSLAAVFSTQVRIFELGSSPQWHQYIRTGQAQIILTGQTPMLKNNSIQAHNMRGVYVYSE